MEFEIFYKKEEISSVKMKADSVHEAIKKFLSVPDDLLETNLQHRKLNKSDGFKIDHIKQDGKSISTDHLLEIVELNNSTIDFDRRSITTEEGSILLTPREFQVFSHLFDKRGTICNADEILKEAMGWVRLKAADTKTVQTHILRIRKKLSSIGSEIKILTIRGAGYIIEV